MGRKLYLLIGLLTVTAVVMLAAAGLAAPLSDVVVRVDITGPIDPGLATILEGAVAEAEAAGARAVLVVVDTPGGLVDSAVRMKNALVRSAVPTIAFVEGHATSAGALITISAEQVYMAVGSTIGAAEPIPYSDKAVSFVRGEFATAATARGRDQKVAEAMVDKNVVIPDITTGVPLTLTNQEAEEAGISDGTVRNATGALASAGFEGVPVVAYEITFQQRLGRWLTSPFVAGLMLIIGIGGLAVEFTKPGVGVPGLIGILGLAGFFGGHYLVGTAEVLEIALVVLGIGLLAIEVLVPGFGVFGIAGIIAMGAGIFMTAPSPQLAAAYMAVAAVGLVVVIIMLFRYISRHGMIRWLRLDRQLDTAGGYVPPAADLKTLIGAAGQVLTPLRPAGTARFGDQKVDVVSEGDFVAAGLTVKVMRVEGTRVVVRVVE